MFRTYKFLTRLLALGTMLIATVSIASDTQKLRIVDGDTLHIDGEKHRLVGYDTLEVCQVCTDQNGEEWYGGQVATQRLKKIVGSQVVRCDTNGKDRYGRWLSTCYAGNVNLNEAMVKEGWAYISPRYEQTYVQLLNQAKEQKIGIWKYNCEPPWEYRKRGASYSCPRL